MLFGFQGFRSWEEAALSLAAWGSGDLEFSVSQRQVDRREKRKGFHGRSSRLMTSRFEALVSSGPGYRICFSVSASHFLNRSSPCLLQCARRTQLLKD